MSSALKSFPTLLRIGFAELVAYRGEVLIWILSTTLPLIMFALWSTLAREAPLGRFDEGAFAAYFLVMLVVRQLTSAWVVWELNYTIRTGALAPLLLRPVHPLLHFLAQGLGALPFRVAVLAPIVGGALLAWPDLPLAPGAAQVALFAWTTLLAFLLTFLFQAIFGTLALYTEQSLSFQEAWFGLWAFLSGYLVPLELMPGVAAATAWLPFRGMASLPVEIALGHLEGAALAEALAVQAGWVVAAALGVRWFWARALRRFEAHGG